MVDPDLAEETDGTEETEENAIRALQCLKTSPVAKENPVQDTSLVN